MANTKIAEILRIPLQNGIVNLLTKNYDPNLNTIIRKIPLSNGKPDSPDTSKKVVFPFRSDGLAVPKELMPEYIRRIGSKQTGKLVTRVAESFSNENNGNFKYRSNDTRLLGKYGIAICSPESLVGGLSTIVIIAYSKDVKVVGKSRDVQIARSDSSNVTSGTECTLIGAKFADLKNCKRITVEESAGCKLEGCLNLTIISSPGTDANEVRTGTVEFSPNSSLVICNNVTIKRSGTVIIVEGDDILLEDSKETHIRKSTNIDLFSSIGSVVTDSEGVYAKGCKELNITKCKPPINEIVDATGDGTNKHIVLTDCPEAVINNCTILNASNSDGLEAINCNEIKKAENCFGLKITDCENVEFTNCHGEYIGLKNAVVIDDVIQVSLPRKVGRGILYGLSFRWLSVFWPKKEKAVSTT